MTPQHDSDRMNKRHVSLLIQSVGWMLIFASFCVHCSSGSSARFDGEHTPGATANAAESMRDACVSGTTAILIFGLGALILVLNKMNNPTDTRASSVSGEARQSDELARHGV